MKLIKSLFYLSNIVIILFYLYPGSILGCFFYKDCETQPQLTRDFIIFSSNHVYLFIALSFLGFLSFKNNIKKIFVYLLILSTFLEIMHLVIPNRGFEMADLLGNILGVIISYTFLKTFYLRK